MVSGFRCGDAPYIFMIISNYSGIWGLLCMCVGEEGGEALGVVGGGVERSCPPVCNDIVTSRHLFLKATSWIRALPRN